MPTTLVVAASLEWTMALHDSVVQVEVITAVGTALAKNRLTYTTPDGPFSDVSPNDITVALAAAIIPVWQDCLSEVAKIIALTTRLDQKPPAYSYPSDTVYLESFGTVEDQMMAPFDTAVIVKQPDPETIDPPLSQAFKNGRVEVSGIPESFNNGGLLTSTGQAAMNALGEAMETFDVTIGGDVVTWTLMMYRLNAGGTSSTNVLVAETYASQRLGSRVSRKFRPNVWL
jgi:hypothetical protein